MAIKFTPMMYARGKYELKTPWIANVAKIYTCIAIRSFEDIYKQGEDVYKTYYEQYVREGDVIGGTAFNFEAETELLPNICTLRSEDNELIYVPDTFILSFPNTTMVPYSNVVIGINLGPLPDELDLLHIEGLLKDNVLKHFGVNAEVNAMRLPMSSNPSPEEHEQLEIVRQAAITNNTSLEERIEGLLKIIDDQRFYIAQLEQSVQG